MYSRIFFYKFTNFLNYFILHFYITHILVVIVYNKLYATRQNLPIPCKTHTLIFGLALWKQNVSLCDHTSRYLLFEDYAPPFFMNNRSFTFWPLFDFLCPWSMLTIEVIFSLFLIILFIFSSNATLFWWLSILPKYGWYSLRWFVCKDTAIDIVWA